MTFRMIQRFFNSLSGVGIVLGVLFFAASLTPTLVPRTWLTQGLLAGACLAAGYGLGVFWRWLWHYMELPEPKERFRFYANIITLLISLTVVSWFLWQTAAWQNSTRLLMKLPPLQTGHPILVSLTAIITFAIILIIARFFKLIVTWVAEKSSNYIPHRIANVLGLTVGIAVFWLLATDVFWRTAFNLIDSSMREYDSLIEPQTPQPLDLLKTGSPQSLLNWQQLGRAGREFISSAPSAQTIADFTGKEAQDPIRVYVGLQVDVDPHVRAQLALSELKRVGAFERANLVIITPTGTGWIDPAAMNAVEYLHHGDIASVAIQYSYLTSPLSLIVEPDRGAEAARALFSAIYNHWTTLPHDSRPRLYLHGLSLGAINSEASVDLFDILGDPIDGALWSGPPFQSPGWRNITNKRLAGTPEWLPQFQDGSLVRFMNQNGYAPDADFAPWGVLRIIYLQYASDPVTFFNPYGFYRRPDWMNPPMGHDVSPELRWYPVVTMMQLLVDMLFATTTPLGYGHLYAPEHYVEAWHEVTAVSDWSQSDLSRLKQYLRDLMDAAVNTQIEPEKPYGNRGG